MDQQLSDALSSVASPGVYDQLETAFDTLTRLNQVTFEEDLEQILHIWDERSGHDNLLNVLSVLEGHVDRVTEQFGVQVNEETDFATRVEILNILSFLPDYGDAALVFNICSRESAPEERLAELMAAIDARPNKLFNYLEALEWVNPALIEKLQQLTEEQLEEPGQDVHEKQRAQFNAYRRGRELFAEIALREGFGFGTELDLLIDRFADELEIYEGRPDSLVRQFLGLLLLSNRWSEDYKTVGEEYLEELARDVNVLSKARMVLADKIKEVYQ